MNKIPDPIKVIGLFLPLPILCFIAGLKWWGFFWLWIGLVLIIMEWMSYACKGRSISEQFWDYDNKKMKAIIVGVWLLFAIYLACHLLWRM